MNNRRAASVTSLYAYPPSRDAITAATSLYDVSGGNGNQWASACADLAARQSVIPEAAATNDVRCSDSAITQSSGVSYSANTPFCSDDK